MASERVGIDLELRGTESIAELKAILSDIENRKYQIRFDTKRALLGIDYQLNKLQNKKLGLKIGAKESIAPLEREILSLQKKKVSLNFDAKQAVAPLQREILAIQRKKLKFEADFSDVTKAIRAEGAKAEELKRQFAENWGIAPSLDNYYDKLGRFDRSIRKLGLDQRGRMLDASDAVRKVDKTISDKNFAKKKINLRVDADMRAVDKQIAGLKSRKIKLKWQADVDKVTLDKNGKIVKQALKAKQAQQETQQSYGQFLRNTQSQISRIGATMMTLGNAMQRITGPINTIMRGFAYGVGYRALNKVTEGFAGAFERYDTFKTYAKQLSALGYDANEKFIIGTGKAQTAIENLNEAVLGLPTGLDEIVASQKRYLAATGDVEKATKIAIAANNAFLADSMDDRAIRYTEKQLRNLLATGKLTDMQWNSLWKNAPLAMSAIAEEMGYSKKGVGQMIAEMKGGQKTVDDFFDAFTRTGISGKLADASNEIKHTFGGVSANINNAFRRMGEGVIKSLDEVLVATTGKDTIDHLISFKESIDDVSESVQNWIKANPDKILDFFDTIKSYDWIGLGKGIAQGFGEAFGFLRRIGDFFLGDSGGAKLGRMMVKINMWGRIISLLGGMFKGLSFPFAAVASLGRWVKDVGGISRLFKLGIFAKLASKAGTVAKGVKGAGNIAAAAAPAMTKWAALAKFGTAAQIGAGGLAIKKVLEGIAEISKVDIPDNIEQILGSATVAIGGLTTLATFAGKALGASPWTALGGAVGGGIAWLVGDAIANVFESIESLANGLKTLHELKPIDKGHFKTVVDSIKEVAPDLKTLYGELKKIFPKDKGKSFAEYSKGEGTIADEVKGMQDALEGIVGVNTAIDDISKIKIDEKKIESAKASISKIGDVIEGLKEDIANVFGKETYRSDRGKSQGGKRTGKWTRGQYDNKSLEQYSEATGYFQEALTNLTGIVTAVSEFQAEFDRVAGDLFTKGKEGYDSTAIQEKIEGIRTFLNSIFTTDGLGTALKGATQTLKDVDTTTISSAFSGLISIITEMYNVQTKLDELSMGESAFDVEGLNLKLGQLGMAIGNLGTALSKAKFDEESLLTIDNIQGAFVKLKSVADQITSMGIDGVLSTIEEAINKIKNFKWGDMNIPPIDIKVQIKLTPLPIDTTPITIAVLGALASINASIVGMPADIEKTVKVTLKSTIVGKDAVVNSVRNAINTIRQQINAIPSTITKTITVRISRQTVTEGGIHTTGGTITRFSTGGYVGGGRPLYRASGGSIFKPKGTDTVPAMLTPGEYVNRRAVVNKLGIPFFQRLNNLDIPGALRELSIRTGMNLGGGTVVNNYNNTTNNLTNNISVPVSEGESKGFTMRKMGRFAGAL